jgi:hypothetical protein
MIPRFDTYQRTAFILIGLSIAIMTVLLITDRRDLTSATLILVAFTSFVTGLFIFSFQREESIDQKFAAIISIPYTYTLSRILADLGVPGHAHFIPVPNIGTFPAAVMQFNPVSNAIPKQPTKDWTFYTENDSPGLLTIPFGIPLLMMMEQYRTITLPSSGLELLELIREVNEDFLEVADKALVSRSGDEFVMILKNFRLIEGCLKIRNESPRNCITAPCPVCSLAGIIIAKGLGNTSVMKQVLVDQGAKDVEIHIEIKGPGETPPLYR